MVVLDGVPCALAGDMDRDPRLGVETWGPVVEGVRCDSIVDTYKWHYRPIQHVECEIRPAYISLLLL